MGKPTEQLRLFTRPIEVVSFWASNTYRCHHKPLGERRYVDLVVDHPEPGEWCVLLCEGEDEPFVGECMAPFLPTRENISHIHSEITRAGPVLLDIVASGDFTWPKDVPELLQNIQSSPVPVSRDLRDESYQRALWAVLERDWGLVLPPPADFGRADIVIQRRQGLPCAAAMEHAVRPLLEAVFGELERQAVSLIQSDGKIVDEARFSSDCGEIVQRFDISDVYGLSLSHEQFIFL